MSDFRQVTPAFWASPQIELDDVQEAQSRGFKLIINNRPDEEEAGQPSGGEIERAARLAGIDVLRVFAHAGEYGAWGRAATAGL